jgi:hypothetical protein
VGLTFRPYLVSTHHLRKADSRTTRHKAHFHFVKLVSCVVVLVGSESPRVLSVTRSLVFGQGRNPRIFMAYRSTRMHALPAVRHGARSAAPSSLRAFSRKSGWALVLCGFVVFANLAYSVVVGHANTTPPANNIARMIPGFATPAPLESVSRYCKMCSGHAN